MFSVCSLSYVNLQTEAVKTDDMWVTTSQTTFFNLHKGGKNLGSQVE